MVTDNSQMSCSPFHFKTSHPYSTKLNMWSRGNLRNYSNWYSEAATAFLSKCSPCVKKQFVWKFSDRKDCVQFLHGVTHKTHLGVQRSHQISISKSLKWMGSSIRLNENKMFPMKLFEDSSVNLWKTEKFGRFNLYRLLEETHSNWVTAIK